ncbi:hypothetical protein CBS63078_6635 [Aspergillus niger]|uniref:Aldehyde dehydrogenase family protein n=1 Tax=Aspergillus niger TaxID=5061 RepID=A0A254TX20_ASPNG|nr:hypothetical protein CBS12448_3585 [Aspergillus niger]KAI2901133.1 hypothetical protein CBS63078_6635 [Aspergillus niger]KAI2965147.1 hypothetical protein CBS147323_5969 [Aspergillus niger]KAI2978598.1 hypothetical protein CBS147324_1386 [Aspergillus niger]KAI2984760.1 hypothetical protein CBS147344_6777 [Aspergillus niger]
MDSIIKIPGAYPRDFTDYRSSPLIVNKLISGAYFTEFAPQVTALLSNYDARVPRETARSIFNKQSNTAAMILGCLNRIVGGILNVTCLLVCFVYSKYRDFRYTSQSGNILDYETATRMLRPILLLLASHEAAQVYSITTDGGVLNGEIAVHAWGHDFELARDLKRYENSLAHDECEEDHLSKTMGRVIRAMGHSHNKLTYIMATAVLTECICNILQVGSRYGLAVMMACILTVLFAAAEDYVDCSTTPVKERREVTLRDLMISALKKSSIRYAKVQRMWTSQKRSTSDSGVLEKYLIKGLKAPTTGTVHDVYVTHYRCGIVVQRSAPEDDMVALASPAESSDDVQEGYKVSYGIRYLAEVNPQDQQAIAKGIGRSWTCLDQTSTLILTECDISDEHADFYFDFDARSDDDNDDDEEEEGIEINGSLKWFL